MKSKALRFLPLAFIAGTHGFALFAPYVGVVLAALHLRTRHRQRGRARAARLAAVGTPAIVPVPPSLDEADLEAAPA
jgi:hypothetical protein